MIFKVETQAYKDNEEKSFNVTLKYIVHFYHSKNKNGNRTCECQIKELDTKRELVHVEVACDSRDNYIKAVGRRLSLQKAYHKLRDEGYPVDSVWLTQMLEQLSIQAPQGMELAKGVNYKVKKKIKIQPIQGSHSINFSKKESERLGDHWVNSWTPKDGDIVKVGDTYYKFDHRYGFIFYTKENFDHGKIDCIEKR